jgi:GT2 family glycosyltransferase
VDGALTAPGGHGDASLAARIRASLLHLLNESLRAGGGAAQSLRAVREALIDGAPGAALRHLDRAWRCLPDDAEMLAPLYGRLLLLDGGDDEAALHLLRRAIALAPDGDAAGLVAVALLRLERLPEACRQMEASLEQYCVVPGRLLAHAAGEFLDHPGVSAPGWIGRGPNLDFVGELSAGESSSSVDIRLDDRPALTHLLRTEPLAGRRSFRLKPPQPTLSAGVEVTGRGIALLGSGARIPETFDLDGRLGTRGHRLKGWARLGWFPSRLLRLRLEDEHASVVEMRTRRVAASISRPCFEIDLRAAQLIGNRLSVSAELPDGRWQPLPDSPLLLAAAVKLEGQPSGRLPRGANGRPAARPPLEFKRAHRTDVIIPVYRGREATLACIESVLSTLDDETSVVIVDDATDDPALIQALDRHADDGRITLLRNATNRGFAASVNRGLARNPTHDGVVLNSDTLVFADWLTRLRAAAYSGEAVGTVTPFSNEGSIASYPRPLGMGIDPADGAALHALAASTHAGTRAEIPVGVGFCLYLRRDCLDDVGKLDSAVFGDGYGEETDFCVRARRRGWSHQLAADVFVYHAGGVSFGRRRAALLDRSQRLLNLRHPGYDRFIAKFLGKDSLHPLRRALDERRLAAAPGRFVLVLTLALSGGVERFVTERCRTLRAQGLTPLVLRPAAAGSARRCELSSDAPELPNLCYDIPAELPALSALLRTLPIEAIEVQHFLDLDARLIDAVRALGVPYDVFVHDYAWICPRITLIDGSGRYCGEPAVAVCEACVAKNGSNLGEPITVTALRARSSEWLGAARRVIAPSKDTAARLERHFAGLEIAVEPLAPPPEPTPLRTPRRASAPGLVRVALIGAIGEHKGYRVLLDCARDARTRRLPLEFVVIGYTENDAPLLETGNVFITGRYGEGEAPHLLRREQADLAWLPSVWPETWCYALDHALEAHLPVAAFDLGAIAERLRSSRRGELMPLDLEARQINDRLLQMAESTGICAVPASRSEQSPLVPLPHDATMIETQLGPLSMINSSDAKPTEAVQQEGLGASVQVLSLPPGLYLVSVKAAEPAVLSAGDRLQLPAMHVGLGPGVNSDQVEFMAGPSTQGAWLFAAADLLVIKVKGGGATLVLTSIRAPGGAALAIKVARLNARDDAAVSVDTLRQAPSAPVFDDPDGDRPIPTHISAHIRSRGDMSFAAAAWAGRVAPGLWIESFSVRPLVRFEAHDLEYKGLTGSGFETPWLSDDESCGTQGMAVPLVGFALRFRPTVATASYDCEYSGYFQSGATVGPLRNGAPCRSTVANDPLEGIQVRLVKRASLASADVAAETSKAVSAAAAIKSSKGVLTAAAIKSSQGVPAIAELEAVAAAPAVPSRTTRSTPRHSSRGP